MADEKKDAQVESTEYQVDVAFGTELDQLESIVAERAGELGANAAAQGDVDGLVFGGSTGLDTPDMAAAAHESAHALNENVGEFDRSVRDAATQATTAVNAAASMAQPSSTVTNGQYQQAVQNADDTVAADAMAVREEQKEYEIERAEDQEAKTLEAQREQEYAEQERQREEQETQAREERERQEQEERERQEREEQEEREREEAERNGEDYDHHDY